MKKGNIVIRFLLILVMISTFTACTTMRIQDVSDIYKSKVTGN
mgnify:CR=1 FL=1